METRFALFAHERANFLAFEIENFDNDVLGLRQRKTNLGFGVKGVGIILRERICRWRCITRESALRSIASECLELV